MSSKIALLGPKGTFSEEAAHSFDPDAEIVLSETIEDVFETVLAGAAEYGVVPVENSLEGSVSATLDMLMKTDVSICAEIVLDICHCLLVLPGTRIENVREVISHPHALAQCRGFIRGMRGVRTRNFPSTAEAAREVADKHLKGTAAIAPLIAAPIYGLEVLKEGIQGQGHNQTRFFVIGLRCLPSSRGKKTSIVIGLKDRPGALYEVLGLFASAGVNLTKIESRPTKKTLGDYIFYIDFTGDAEDEKIRAMLDELRGMTTMLKLLGSYPASSGQ